MFVYTNNINPLISLYSFQIKQKMRALDQTRHLLILISPKSGLHNDIIFYKLKPLFQQKQKFKINLKLVSMFCVSTSYITRKK